MERRSGWEIHYFLNHLASGVDLVPGSKRLSLLRVDQEGMVHLLHSLLSVLVRLYYMARRIFDCLGELPNEGLPMVLEITVDAFTARQFVCATQWADHVIHLERVTPLQFGNPCLVRGW